MKASSPVAPGARATPQRVAVLGGTGFLGRSLCERLVRAAGGGGRLRVVTRRIAHGRAL